jgi:hypothetical protein
LNRPGPDCLQYSTSISMVHDSLLFFLSTIIPLMLMLPFLTGHKRVTLNLIYLGALILPCHNKSLNLFIFFILYSLHKIKIPFYGCGKLLASVQLNLCILFYALAISKPIFLNLFGLLRFLLNIDYFFEWCYITKYLQKTI